MVGHYFLEEQGTYKSQNMTCISQCHILYLSNKTPSCLRFSAHSNSKKTSSRKFYAEKKKLTENRCHRTITTAYQHATPFVDPVPKSFFRTKLGSTSSQSPPLLCMSRTIACYIKTGHCFMHLNSKWFNSILNTAWIKRRPQAATASSSRS